MNDKPPHQNDPTVSPLAARLQELMGALQQDLPYFSQHLGCSEQMLHDYLDHTTGANLEFLAMVLSKVHEVQAEWLLTGRGPMLRTPLATTYKGNNGNTVGSNTGIVLNVTFSECKQQLQLASLLMEQQQHRLDDKDRLIQLLENQLAK